MHTNNLLGTTQSTTPTPAPCAPKPASNGKVWADVPRSTYASRQAWRLPKRAGGKGKFARQVTAVQSANGYTASKHKSLYPYSAKNAKGYYQNAVATAYGVALALGATAQVQVYLPTGKGGKPMYAQGAARVVVA